MFKITFKTDTKLSTITDKPTEVVFDANARIKEYVDKYYPNAYKFETDSDCLIIYNPVHGDLDIIKVSLDIVING